MPISKIGLFLRATLLALTLMATPAFSQAPSVEVLEWRLTGADTTDPNWVEDYLDLKLPARMDRNDLQFLEEKLMTTEVFTSVRVNLIPREDLPQKAILHIDVTEKWTIVPVVRAAYGGGTPLTVIGAYHKHAFGKLWTLGLETQKYGDAPLGGVLWARAPRWRQGHHLLSFELWKDNRVRSVYDDEDEMVGSYQSRAHMARFQFLAPLGESAAERTHGGWQYGLDFRLRTQEPTRFKAAKKHPNATAPRDIDVNPEKDFEARPLLKLVYDDIISDQLNLNGTRFVATTGTAYEEVRTSTVTELEAFQFWLLPDDWNIGLHGLVATSSHASLQNTYFLGGFDSIRGIPDGAVYGPKAAYANAELRKITWRSKYLWVQNVVFADAGSAGQEWSDLGDQVRSAAGMGVRLSIPQVYRLVFRIDYAWSLDRPGTHGITAGMNQFFQPHKPL